MLDRELCLKLVFDNDGVEYLPVGKALETTKYDTRPILHQVKSNDKFKVLDLPLLRYKGLKGSAIGSRCLRLEDFDTFNKILESLLLEKPNIFSVDGKVTRVCQHCAKTFVTQNNSHEYKFCSHRCSADNTKASLESECSVCGNRFHRKSYHRNKTKNMTCSRECTAILRQTLYRGKDNPNYKARNYTCDGYVLTPPHAESRSDGIVEALLHKAICCEVLGVNKVSGKFMHVHHRDCDKFNNKASNLVILNLSDHRWLHAQFGNATLWAYQKGKITLDNLMSWSDDPDRARRLLDLSVLDQTAEELGSIVNGTLYYHGETNEIQETLQ